MVAALLWMLVSIWNTPPATLGEAAMREAVRRQRLAPSTRVYNDQTLGPAPARAEPPASADPPVVQTEVVADPEVAAATQAVAPPEPPSEPKPDVKNAAWWGARMTTAREALARDRVLAEALQSRVSALNNDIAARDDPAQRAVLMNARQEALAELDRMKKQVDTDVLTIAAIQEEARKAGVPPGWIR